MVQGWASAVADLRHMLETLLEMWLRLLLKYVMPVHCEPYAVSV